MKNKKAYKISMSAMFTALIFVATYLIAIPMPVVGYVNLGDAFVIISTVLLGPICGAICSGFGSMLADIMLGYAVYAPATLVIKAVMAIACYFIYKLTSTLMKRPFSLAISAIVAECVMVVGYFLFEGAFVIGFAGAMANILFNLIQGGISIIVSNIIINLLLSSKAIQKQLQ